MTEPFQGLSHKTEFVCALLAADGLGIFAAAQPVDVTDQTVEWLLGEGTNREEQGGHHRAEDGGAGNDHHDRLCFHGGSGGAVRNVDNDGPVGVDAGNGEREEQSVKTFLAFDLEVGDEVRGAGRQGGLQRVGALAFIGLHHQVVGRGNDPLAVLGDEHDAAGFERTQGLQLVRERGQRDIDTRDTNQLARRHDRIGDRGHRHRHVGILRLIGSGNCTLARCFCQGIPLGFVVVLEG